MTFYLYKGRTFTFFPDADELFTFRSTLQSLLSPNKRLQVLLHDEYLSKEKLLLVYLDILFPFVFYVAIFGFFQGNVKRILVFTKFSVICESESLDQWLSAGNK